MSRGAAGVVGRDFSKPPSSHGHHLALEGTSLFLASLAPLLLRCVPQRSLVNCASALLWLFAWEKRPWLGLGTLIGVCDSVGSPRCQN